MASITTTLALAPQGDDLPTIRTHVWANDGGDQCAAVYFQLGTSEFGFNASADQVARLLLDALNNLGEAVDPVALAPAGQAVPA